MPPLRSIRLFVLFLDAMNGIERSSGFIERPTPSKWKKGSLLWGNMQRAITDDFDFDKG
jgi:hypothetical protein